MFIWSWNPFAVAAALFLVDFGAILVVRRIWEGRFYLGRWWTYRIGDSVFLPAYGCFTAVVVQHATAPPPIYGEWRWHVGVLLVGYAIMLRGEYLHVRNGIYTLRQQLRGSQLYHSVIFGPMFYLIMSMAPFVLECWEVWWANVGALIALLAFGITVVVDNSSLVSKEPEPQRR